MRNSSEIVLDDPLLLDREVEGMLRKAKGFCAKDKSVRREFLS